MARTVTRRTANQGWLLLAALVGSSGLGLTGIAFSLDLALARGFGGILIVLAAVCALVAYSLPVPPRRAPLKDDPQTVIHRRACLRARQDLQQAQPRPRVNGARRPQLWLVDRHDSNGDAA